MNNDYGFAEKHEAVLCLLDEIDRLCRENGIKYSLHGGTLLGAELNGHLIPWDDDADTITDNTVRSDKTIITDIYTSDFFINSSAFALSFKQAIENMMNRIMRQERDI